MICFRRLLQVSVIDLAVLLVAFASHGFTHSALAASNKSETGDSSLASTIVLSNTGELSSTQRAGALVLVFDSFSVDAIDPAVNKWVSERISTRSPDSIASSDCVAVISAGFSVLAYSTITHEWSSLRATNPTKITASGCIGVVTDDFSVSAFNGLTGEWKSVRTVDKTADVRVVP